MLDRLTRNSLSASLDEQQNALRDYSSEGHSVSFSIDCGSSAAANIMMFSILEMHHDKTINAVLKIEETILSVSLQHYDADDHDSVFALIKDINRKALKIKHG